MNDKWRKREMATGIVKSYNPAKGFGFIRPDSGELVDDHGLSTEPTRSFDLP
jgi:'Cold-shock' DNA-binding domain